MGLGIVLFVLASWATSPTLVDGRCSACWLTGERSTVPAGTCARTLLAYQSYYDEEGRLHGHDLNTTTCAATCSRGHHLVWTFK